MVFAGATYKLHLDTKLPPHLPGLSHLDTSAWTRNFAAVYRDLGKNHATATQTATNQTAGPLAARQICTELAVYQDFASAQARVLQPIPATVPALQNTCFFHRSIQICIPVFYHNFTIPQ
jgi:hypothetical protein